MKSKKFIRRLAKIGIEVELVANYPWVYLDKVNGTKVTSNFLANHGFTPFFANSENGCRFSDRRKVFQKIRQVLAYNCYTQLTQEIGDYEK
jgi:hypothetical protein